MNTQLTKDIEFGVQSDQDTEKVESDLKDLISNTGPSTDQNKPDIHTRGGILAGLCSYFVPSLQKLANREHLGNYVASSRGPNPVKVFMCGFPCIFFSSPPTGQTRKRVENLLASQSIRQGKMFDDPVGALAYINSFIKEYSLEDSLKELVEPDPAKYATFNQFFSRALRPDARPIDSVTDDSIIVSAADCRVTVYETVASAEEFWIKGRSFTLSSLLGDTEKAFKFGDAAIAIFRLAPADYHRPLRGVIGKISHIPGQYYTVNPQDINEDFDVFTANKRDVTVINTPINGGILPVAFVAIGAMLVGSIFWSVPEDSEIQKGQELGGFSYGGSTVIAVFPNGTVEFDEDLIANSKLSLETVVKVGNHIGKFI